MLLVDQLRRARAVFGAMIVVLTLYGMLGACLYLQRVGLLPEATRP